MTAPNIAFLASEKPEAQAALEHLAAAHGQTAPDEADIIAPIGGDGFMLETLRAHMDARARFYGIHQGTVGFLMNRYAPEELIDRLQEAVAAHVRPLVMRAETQDGSVHEALAINEVSLFRETRQTARIRIGVNGVTRLEELVCDGVMVATPAGSTAYNLSAHGPILPIDARLLAMTPISAFRPRRWRGALLPHRARVEMTVRDAERRPVAAVADNYEVRDVARVEIWEHPHRRMTLLFDRGHSLEDRILSEQFDY
ncbi:MAG: NAD kinase [Pseudomonadota bacterium]